MGKCDLCGKEVLIPFKCSYCGQNFCSEHRLPEKHMCPALPAMEKEWKFDKGRMEKDARGLASTTSRRSLIGHDDRDVNLEGYRKSDDKESNKSTTPTRIRSKLTRFTSFFLKTIKFIGFSLFSVVTSLPILMYGYFLVDPTSQGVFGLIYLVNPDTLFFSVLIPSIIYVVFWLYVVYSIIKGKAKWWFFLILLMIGIWNWWMVFKISTLVAFFEGL